MFRSDELIIRMLLPTVKVIAAPKKPRIVLKLIKIKNNKADLHIYNYDVNLMGSKTLP